MSSRAASAQHKKRRSTIVDQKEADLLKHGDRGSFASGLAGAGGSSATSRLVQWLMGRPDSSGFSQASCWIWHTWSAVIRAGLPGRGSSSSRSSMLKSDRAIGCKSTHRCRHCRTISRESFCSRMIWLLLLPSLAANRIRALLAICWRTLRRLINWCRPAFSLSVMVDSATP